MPRRALVRAGGGACSTAGAGCRGAAWAGGADIRRTCCSSQQGAQRSRGLGQGRARAHSLVEPAGRRERVHSLLAQHHALLGVRVVALVAAVGGGGRQSGRGGGRRGAHRGMGRRGVAGQACEPTACTRRLWHRATGVEQRGDTPSTQQRGSPGEGEGRRGGGAGGRAALGLGAAATGGDRRAAGAAGAPRAAAPAHGAGPWGMEGEGERRRESAGRSGRSPSPGLRSDAVPQPPANRRPRCPAHAAHPWPTRPRRRLRLHRRRRRWPGAACCAGERERVGILRCGGRRWALRDWRAGSGREARQCGARRRPPAIATASPPDPGFRQPAARAPQLEPRCRVRSDRRLPGPRAHVCSSPRVRGCQGAAREQRGAQKREECSRHCGARETQGRWGCKPLDWEVYRCLQAIEGGIAQARRARGHNDCLAAAAAAAPRHQAFLQAHRLAAVGNRVWNQRGDAPRRVEPMQPAAQGQQLAARSGRAGGCRPTEPALGCT